MRRRPIVPGHVACKAIAVAAILLLRAAAPASALVATNVILFIGDGMGRGQIEAGRFFTGKALSFETWAFQAEMTTHSASAPAVTDSAAAGTAMATGHKVYNGALSVALPGDGRVWESAMEYLHRKGKRAGLVTTSYMTDATPAAFGAHQVSRGLWAQIADDYLFGSRFQVLLGGGGNGMTPAVAAAAGYTVAQNRWQMQALDPQTVVALSGQFGYGSMPYEKDGLGDLPHLSQMTETALQVLSAGTRGFFLMVEGGRIDHACHANDIARCVREVAEFDPAVRVALTWIGGRTDTLVLVTADHETGGLKVLQDNGPGNEPTVAWGSTGHTGTNVPVFARGPGAERVTGTLDNTDIYRIVMKTQPVVPEAVGIGRESGAGVRTDWNANPGDTCRLDATCSLLATQWSVVATATANTHEVRIMDTNQPLPQARYYRLVVTQ